jgi:hypothetical protein
MLAGGEGKEGEEQEEVTGYLGVVLARRKAAGGVLSATAAAKRPWRRCTAVLRRGSSSVVDR